MRFAAFVLCAIPLAASALPCAADTLPPRTPGLWESSIVGAALPKGTKVRQCIDETTDKLAEAATTPGATCSKREIRKVDAGYEIESVCTVGGITAEGKGLISGDFATSVKLDMTTTIKGIPGMPTPMTQKMTITATRLGECGAGQKPGDIVTPGGKVMHMPGK